MSNHARGFRLVWGFLAVLLTAGLYTFAALAAPALPSLTGRIVDNAAILDSTTKTVLDQKLSDWEKKTGDQLVITTVPALNGEDIESFSNRLFRNWQLGQSKVNNGVLMVVAPNDRQVRIEVGYGLEGTLTDVLSSVIINTFILPAFRDGDYNKGIIEGTDAIMVAISGDKADLDARIRQKQAADAKEAASQERIAMIGQLIVTAIVILIFLLPIFARIFGKKVGPNKYLWLGIIFTLGAGSGGGGGGSFGGGGFGGGGFGGGGFSGGGGSSGGGGASGRW